MAEENGTENGGNMTGAQTETEIEIKAEADTVIRP